MIGHCPLHRQCPDIMREAFFNLCGTLAFLFLFTLAMCIFIAIIQVIFNKQARDDWRWLYRYITTRLKAIKVMFIAYLCVKLRHLYEFMERSINNAA